MRKIIVYLNIALLLMAHGVYGAAAATTTTGDPVAVGATASAGVISTEPEAAAGAGAAAPPPAPYKPAKAFEDLATEMLAQEPWKSRHASDCAILIPHDSGCYISSGTFMTTDTGQPFILICRHALEHAIRDIIVRFSDGSQYFAKAHMAPSPNPHVNFCFEEGFVYKGDLKKPVTIHILNGKVINYSHSYCAWDDAVTLIRADGTEETLPGLDTLPAGARRDRISLMRDYAVLILDKYPSDITPAKIALVDSVPTPKKIYGDDEMQEFMHAHEDTALDSTSPPIDAAAQARIPCSLSGYGGLVGELSEYCFSPAIQNPNRPKQSFRLVDMEHCEGQPCIKTYKNDRGMDMPAIGAFIEPYGFAEASPENRECWALLSKSLPNRQVAVVPCEIEKIGLSLPTFEGFSGASLRDNTGVIGINSTCLAFPYRVQGPFREYQIKYNIYHTLIPERDRIHEMVDGYYAEQARIKKVRSDAEKEVQEKKARTAEALQSQPYPIAVQNYSLWAF